METSSQIITANTLTRIGMHGFANIELECDKNSKTFVKKLKTSPPILIQKALYTETARPNKAHLFLMSSAGGMLQGDTLDINVIAKKNTDTYITTQAATKVYKSENSDCRQYINITVGKNCFFEFFPQQIIPHKDSKFFQDVKISIDEDSTMIYSEILTMGRIAHGEIFDFDSIRLRLSCSDQNGRILFTDSSNIEPKNNKTKFNSLFGNQKIYASIFIISPKADSENLGNEINELFKTNNLIGFSQLPNNSGVVIRILSNSIDEINNSISKIRKLTCNNMSNKN